MSTIYLAQDKRPQPRHDPILSEWFPSYAEKGISEAAAAKAIASLETWAKQRFNAAVTMQETPTGFGMQLLHFTLPRDTQGQPYRYFGVPEHIARLCHAHSWQHRIETFNQGTGFQYDARIAYLSHARRVPVYLADSFVEDEKDQPLLACPGWYFAEVTVPAKWQHIGIVPSLQYTSNSKGRVYPNQPGIKFDAWLNDHEIRLLQNNFWNFRIRKRVLFADNSIPGTDPLRHWRDNLATALAGIEALPDYATNQHWQLMRSGMRSMALNVIGQFHHNGLGKQGQEQITGNSRTGFACKPGGPTLTDFTARWYHPEWSGAIWARARARATNIALSIPYNQLLKIYGDAVICKNPIPLIQDTGKVGAYRLKGAANAQKD